MSPSCAVRDVFDVSSTSEQDHGVWLDITWKNLIASEGIRDDINNYLIEKITLSTLADCAKDLPPLHLLSLFKDDPPTLDKWKMMWNFFDFSVVLQDINPDCFGIKINRNGKLVYMEGTTEGETAVNVNVLEEKGKKKKKKKLNVLEEEGKERKKEEDVQLIKVTPTELIAFTKWLLLTGEEVRHLVCYSPSSPLTEELSVNKFIKLLRGITGCA